MAAHDRGRAKCGEREGLAISQKKIFFYANGWIATELTHDGPQTGLHRER